MHDENVGHRMEHTWFVVADQYQAQIYRLRGPRMKAKLEAIETLSPEEPYGQRKGPQDDPMHHSFSDPKGPAAESQRRFARQVVERLKKSHHGGELRELYIAAPANFVGTIRGLYGNALAASVRREIIGDYTHHKVCDLNSRIHRWIN